MRTKKLVFLDTETTGLGPETEVWEVGAILRHPAPGVDDDGWTPEAKPVDLEYAWQIRPRMEHAEPTGLRIGRYYERVGGLVTYDIDEAVCTAHPSRDAIGERTNAARIAAELAPILDGATIVGAVPDFDTRHLARFLTRWHQAGTWHYHLVDVETLAAGRLGQQPPWGFDDLLFAYGLRYDEDDRHTALGDARMVRDLYDAVWEHAARPMWTQGDVDELGERITKALAAEDLDHVRSLILGAAQGPSPF